MNHDIKIIDPNGKKWTISVDSQVLLLGKRKCPTNLGNIDTLATVLREIETTIATNGDFCHYQDLINGSNLLRILDSLYRDSFFQSWKYRYKQESVPEPLCFKRFFIKVFGFCPKAKHQCQLFELIYHYTNEKYHHYIQEQESLRQNIYEQSMQASNDGYTIKKLFDEAIVGDNVAIFEINGQQLSVCLVNRPELSNATVLLSHIMDLKTAFCHGDAPLLKSCLSVLGYTAALDTAQLLFPNEAKSFFLEQAEHQIADRVLVHPRALLRSYIKTTPLQPHPACILYERILSSMEETLPCWNKILLDSNINELASNKPDWVIYSESPQSFQLSLHNIHFAGCPKLIAECQDYCRFKCGYGKKELDLPTLFRYTDLFYLAFTILYDDLDIYLDSIKDLTAEDVLFFENFMLQSTAYSLKTIRNLLMVLNGFYRYETQIKNDSPMSAFYKIKFPREAVTSLTITNPITKELVSYLQTALDSTIPVVKLGYEISLATGLRAGSFDVLTTKSLVKRDDGYAIRIFFKKTAAYRIKNGRPVYRDYKITQDLADEIQQFIADTADLRAKLSQPFLLVFESENYRHDSKYPPSVLTSKFLNYYINESLNKSGLLNPDNMPETFNLRRVRAEIGRQLFSAGSTPSEVAEFLGNTPVIAEHHYHNLMRADEAALYNTLYDATVLPSIQPPGSTSAEVPKPTSVLYGSCCSTPCDLPNCENCPFLISKEDDPS